MTDLSRGHGGAWQLEVYAEPSGREPFTAFVESIDDFTFAALDAALRVVLASRGLDLVRTEWLKPLGDGLHEFRIRHDADEILCMFGDDHAADVTNVLGPPRPVLLRVFVHFHGNRVVLLLAGYDKGHDSSVRRQNREIAAARKLLTAWRATEQRRRKANRRGG